VSEVIKAPNPMPLDERRKVFLAGSIEMGKAEDWQARVCKMLADENLVLLSPRRDDFDPDAEQSVENDYFRGQVIWELEALEHADAILMYFDPDTRSPITLLELGLYARSGKLLVVCPEGYWRRGNVDVVCRHYDIESFQRLEEAVDIFRDSVEGWA
jgi:predicted SnoaL-like aldol condensation-catalyzing enzyme